GPPEELPCSFSSILLLLMAGHELPAALGGGIVEYLLRSADLFHLSLMQEHHLTGHLTGKAHLVGNQQHSTSFFGQGPDNHEYLVDHFRIQRRRRLVEQYDL